LLPLRRCITARALSSSHESGKAIIFLAIAILPKKFKQKPAAKNFKKVHAFIKRKNGIHSVQQDEVPEIRRGVTKIIGWGE